MAPAPILALPLHVVGSILKKLPDTKSLLAAVASHSIFYRSLKDHEDTITRSVISAETSKALYPFALAAYAIRSRASSFDYEYICNVLYDLQYRILCFPSRGKVGFRCRPDLRAVSYINALHDSVTHFTNRIGDEAIPRGIYDLGLERIDRKHLSESERLIIERALYRFQIFSEILMACDNARDSTGSLPTGVFTETFVTELWLGPFAPWINEQLATVYDYLLSFTASKFDRVAQHDLEWGALQVDYSSKTTENPYLRGLVTRGLHFLRRLDTAPQYKEFRRILNEKGILYSTRGLDEYLQRCIDWTYFGVQDATNAHHFSDKGLTRIARQLSYRTWMLYCKRMDAKFMPAGMGEGDGKGEEYNRLRHLKVDDSTRFPCQAWKIAHRRLDIRKSVYNTDMRCVRLSGYVLWDEPESEAYLFGLMEHLIPAMVVANRTLLSETDRIENLRNASWQARLDIYQQGGRGYWSEDGVHDIEWTEEKVDYHTVLRLKKDRRDMTIPQEPDEANDSDSSSLPEESIQNIE